MTNDHTLGEPVHELPTLKAFQFFQTPPHRPSLMKQILNTFVRLSIPTTQTLKIVLHGRKLQ